MKNVLGYYRTEGIRRAYHKLIPDMDQQHIDNYVAQQFTAKIEEEKNKCRELWHTVLEMSKNQVVENAI